MLLVQLLLQSCSCSHSVLDCSLVCLVVNYAQFNCQFVRFVVPQKPLRQTARFPQMDTFCASGWFVVRTGYKLRQMFSPMYNILRACICPLHHGIRTVLYSAHFMKPSWNVSHTNKPIGNCLWTVKTVPNWLVCTQSLTWPAVYFNSDSFKQLLTSNPPSFFCRCVRAVYSTVCYQWLPRCAEVQVQVPSYQPTHKSTGQ